MKKLWENYKKPTPDKWRKIGDSLLAISAFMAGFTMIEGWSKWIAMGTFFTGIAGKFLTNLFAPKNDSTSN